MFTMSDKGIKNPRILEILKDDKGQDIRKEMLKIAGEFYWQDSPEYETIFSFIDVFFEEYQPESSKREDYTDEEALLVRSGEITEDEFSYHLKNRCPTCNKFPILCGCGTPNSMET